jgi:hypothetical protein
MKGLFAPKWADWERKGLNAATMRSGFPAPFVNALENKKSSKITLRLNSYAENK